MAAGDSVLRARDNQIKPPDRSGNGSTTANTSALEPINSKINTGGPISPKKLNGSGKNT
jgi:hypothetical protein